MCLHSPKLLPSESPPFNFLPPHPLALLCMRDCYSAFIACRMINVEGMSIFVFITDTAFWSKDLRQASQQCPKNIKRKFWSNKFIYPCLQQHDDIHGAGKPHFSHTRNIYIFIVSSFYFLTNCSYSKEKRKGLPHSSGKMAARMVKEPYVVSCNRAFV